MDDSAAGGPNEVECQESAVIEEGDPSDVVGVIADEEITFPEIDIGWDGSDVGVVQPSCAGGLSLDIELLDLAYSGVDLFVMASIGAKRLVLLDGEFTMSPYQDQDIPIDISPALQLDGKQTRYATSIMGSFRLLDSGGNVVHKTGRLDELYLVLHPSGDCELLDRTALLTSYPLGITDATEAARVEALLAQLPDEDGVHAEFIGSGVYIEGDFYPDDQVPVSD